MLMVFIQGLLGMNILSTNPDDFSTFSNFTNATIGHLSADSKNSTGALLASMASSSTYLWDWKYFGIITGPLMLSIPLSILAGDILRTAVRSATIYVAYWRILVGLFGLIAWLGIYWALPYADNNATDTGPFYFCPLSDYSPGLFNCWGPLYITYIVINAVFLGGFALWRVYFALRRNTRSGIWLLFLPIVANCMLVDIIYMNGRYPYIAPDPVMSIPYFYLLLVWRGDKVRKWIGRKLQRAD